MPDDLRKQFAALGIDPNQSQAASLAEMIVKAQSRMKELVRELAANEPRLKNADATVTLSAAPAHTAHVNPPDYGTIRVSLGVLLFPGAVTRSLAPLLPWQFKIDISVFAHELEGVEQTFSLQHARFHRLTSAPPSGWASGAPLELHRALVAQSDFGVTVFPSFARDHFVPLAHDPNGVGHPLEVCRHLADGWLDFVLAHELGHVLSTEESRGAASGRMHSPSADKDQRQQEEFKADATAIDILIKHYTKQRNRRGWFGPYSRWRERNRVSAVVLTYARLFFLTLPAMGIDVAGLEDRWNRIASSFPAALNSPQISCLDQAFGLARDTGESTTVRSPLDDVLASHLERKLDASAYAEAVESWFYYGTKDALVADFQRLCSEAAANGGDAARMQYLEHLRGRLVANGTLRGVR